MNKAKLLTITVITLLLLNLGTVGFLFFSGSKGHPTHRGMGREGRPKPREIIIEKLHFDDAQIIKYDKLIQWHRKNIEEREGKIRASKNNLYLLLNEAVADETKKDSLINVLSSSQKEIEAIHFKHFQDIKKLCKKEQLSDFESLTEKLSRLFSKPPKPRE